MWNRNFAPALRIARVRGLAHPERTEALVQGFSLPGVWLPDEVTVMAEAYEVLSHRRRRAAALPETERETIARNIIAAARDGCYDVSDLVRRCDRLDRRH